MKHEKDPNDWASEFEDLGRQVGRAARDLLRDGEWRFKRDVEWRLKRELRRAAKGIRIDCRRPPIVDEPPIIEEPPIVEEAPNAYRVRDEEKTSEPVDPPIVENVPTRSKTISPVSVSGILMSVFGFVTMGFFGLFALFLLAYILTAASGGALTIAIVSMSVFLALGAAGGVVGIRGVSRCGRQKRLCVYQREIGASEFCPIALLASAVGCSADFVARDLQKLLKDGRFPGAKLDAEKTCLILNEETYRHYLLAEEKMRRQREAEQKKAAEPPEPDSPLAAAIAEGEKRLEEIRQINDKIPGEEISRKISHMEIVTEKIFDCVRRHPDKLPEIRKFMSYYLPTTLKLLNTYHEFDRQPVQGENIVQAKNEISTALDTINTAFENLLDSLFEDTAFDVATDISVLETMLAQEGLTGQDSFKKNE